MQISEITPIDSNYPDSLREIPSVPKTLYFLGELPNRPTVAIVGARRPTEYGKRVTYQLASELASAGIAIVSGLAYGLDSIAHTGALDAGGQTIAVLAGGLHKIYPAGHRNLAIRILQSGGGIVSEYPEGMPSLRQYFPARNRIVSGLSLAVIIPEAEASSGSLITAKFALNQNRLVMAVPGNITSPTSAGPNNLIRSGAIPVTNSSDVLAALDLTTADAKPTAQPKSKEEALILELLEKGINSSEDLIQASELGASQFANVITLMEITGKVRNLGAGQWVAR
ncbi:MAG TPA: DNA-processing protein DprA [Candidatus Saccharimonadales bacterium]|nr:DNA-processing protein DprA [Candidatus Saccharimonadales bacterium]